MTLSDLIKLAKEPMQEQNYQLNMLQRDRCAEKSREALQKNDVYMFKFWSNASREFERRATEKLSETLRRKHELVLSR